MLVLSVITGVCIIVSFLFDSKKTIKGIKKGLIMFFNLLPTLLLMLALVSIVFYLVPNESMIKYMGKDSGVAGWLIAASLGSLSLIPGFIAFPLCSILLKSGVGYPTIAVFITTLMMVGIVTLPVEAKFFGWRVSIIRNSVSFVAALLIGIIMMFLL